MTMGTRGARLSPLSFALAALVAGCTLTFLVERSEAGNSACSAFNDGVDGPFWCARARLARARAAGGLRARCARRVARGRAPRRAVAGALVGCGAPRAAPRRPAARAAHGAPARA